MCCPTGASSLQAIINGMPPASTSCLIGTDKSGSIVAHSDNAPELLPTRGPLIGRKIHLLHGHSRFKDFLDSIGEVPHAEEGMTGAGAATVLTAEMIHSIRPTNSITDRIITISGSHFHLFTLTHIQEDETPSRLDRIIDRLSSGPAHSEQDSSIKLKLIELMKRLVATGMKEGCTPFPLSDLENRFEREYLSPWNDIYRKERFTTTPAKDSETKLTFRCEMTTIIDLLRIVCSYCLLDFPSSTCFNITYTTEEKFVSIRFTPTQILFPSTDTRPPGLSPIRPPISLLVPASQSTLEEPSPSSSPLDQLEEFLRLLEDPSRLGVKATVTRAGSRSMITVQIPVVH